MSLVSLSDHRVAFGNQLSVLRKNRSLTQRALQCASGVASSLISAFEHGDRAVGPEIAVRLADGLGLSPVERDEFLLSAARTRRRDRLVGYARQLPPEILNFLPRALGRIKIDLENIQSPEIRAKRGAKEQEALVLTSGNHRYLCTIRVEEME